MLQTIPARKRRRSRRTRRWFLKTTGRAAAIAAGGGLLDAAVLQPRWIMISRPTAPVRHLPPAWDGARIAHLTDLHAGRLCGLDYLRRVVAASNAAGPDLVVLTGDYFTGARGVTGRLGDVLSGLEAPKGKFAVLGNHDYRGDPHRVTRVLESAGIEVLTNAHRLVEHDGQPLCIAGVDDLRRGRPDIAAALAGVDESVPRVLLAHNPHFAERMGPAHRVDLLLCGHTHGGQIRLPFGLTPFVSARGRKYLEGMVGGPHCPVYVSRGVGMVGVPLRMNCRPELPVITLRSA